LPFANYCLMSFQRLQIRYQTARSLPAPYAYFYTLTAQPAANSDVQIDLTMTYPDRDDIDEDELIAEGFTRTDDLTWSGQLPKSWLETLTNLARATRLQPLDEEAMGEDDDFREITLEISGEKKKQGVPKNGDDWHYAMQELIQAIYERMNRERPFELTYVDNSAGTLEHRLTASFAERTIRLQRLQNQREQSSTLPWSTLQQVMGQVYEHDFNPQDAQLKRPSRNGQWLNLGTDEWYDISRLKSLTRFLTDL
jgi:hypothetical protein